MIKTSFAFLFCLITLCSDAQKKEYIELYNGYYIVQQDGKEALADSKKNLTYRIRFRVALQPERFGRIRGFERWTMRTHRYGRETSSSLLNTFYLGVLLVSMTVMMVLVAYAEVCSYFYFKRKESKRTGEDERGTFSKKEARRKIE